MTIKALSVTACLSFALSACGGDPANNSPADQPLYEFTADQAPEVCEGTGIATGDEVAVSGEVDLRSAPSDTAEKIINRKATEILGETHYHQLDQTEQLKELCRQEAWSKVQVMEPDWLRDVIGWVPVSALRAIERDKSGKRTYIETDFLSDKETSPYKPQLVAAVNRIVRENARCPSIDPGTLSKSGNRGTKTKPVFFITCQSEPPFNVWFEPEDASSGKSFAAIQNIERSSALRACEAAARNAANNPQTVEFSKFMDVAFVPYPNGSSRLLSTFTAKNAFGVEGKFRIGCFFEGTALTEQTISEDYE